MLIDLYFAVSLNSSKQSIFLCMVFLSICLRRATCKIVYAVFRTSKNLEIIKNKNDPTGQSCLVCESDNSHGMKSEVTG